MSILSLLFYSWREYCLFLASVALVAVDPLGCRGRDVGNDEVLQHAEEQTLKSGFEHGAA
jgi:hypothetical protein